MTKTFPALATICIVLLTGCASYQISTQSLSDQLSGNVVDKGYFTASGSVKGNDLQTLKCVDKNGTTKDVRVTNRTGIRITKNDGSKTTFYANTVLLMDSAIYGSKTHFFNAQIKPIKLSDVSKIEVLQ